MRAKLRRSRARQILGCASSVELRAERPAILGNRLSGVAVKLAGFGDIFSSRGVIFAASGAPGIPRGPRFFRAISSSVCLSSSRIPGFIYIAPLRFALFAVCRWQHLPRWGSGDNLSCSVAA